MICDQCQCRCEVTLADHTEVTPHTFTPRLAFDYATECFMIKHFMTATRSGTRAKEINLPPVHSAEKAIDPTLKPESQSKTQEILAKPAPITPGRKAANPTVGWTPSQTPISNKAREDLSSTSKSTSRSLLNIPVQSQTPMLTKAPSLASAIQNIVHQQTPVRNQLFNKNTH